MRHRERLHYEMRVNGFPHSDESDAELIRLWPNKQLSNEAIAAALVEKFGGHLTRSGAGGRGYRLGLPKRGHPVAMSDDERNTRERDRKRRQRESDRKKRKDGGISRITGQRKRNPDFAAPILDTYVAPPIELRADDIPIKQRKQLLELTETTCRFPYGDVGKPGFFFCGAHAEKGRPYCLEHCHITYSVRTKISGFGISAKSQAMRKLFDATGLGIPFEGSPTA